MVAWFAAIMLVITIGQGQPCSDFDPQGCAAKPSLCNDPSLAEVVCPLSCKICGKLLFIV